jgi:hypothetical protein
VTSWRKPRDLLDEVIELREQAKHLCEVTRALLEERRRIVAIARTVRSRLQGDLCRMIPADAKNGTNRRRSSAPW